MKTENEMVPIEVFAGPFLQAEFVKSLLENAEIEVFLNDSINGTLVPWVVSPGGANPVKVIVSSLDSEKAKYIVEEYEENLRKKE
jgi:hypothetical protein